MQLNFKNKVVLVTGGSRGIGLATSVEFAKCGAVVIIASRDIKRGLNASKKISRHGMCHFISVDFRIKSDIDQLFKIIIKKFGKIDIAINNAGIEGKSFTKIIDYPDSVCDEVVAINMKAIWFCVKHELKLMLKQNTKGCILNVSSVAGVRASLTGGSAYTMTKHAVVGLTKAVAKEYAPSGIRVNAICPGLIATEEVVKLVSERKIDNIGLVHPIGRLITPTEVAQNILWLSSDYAAPITGGIIPIDGGALS